MNDEIFKIYIGYMVLYTLIFHVFIILVYYYYSVVAMCCSRWLPLTKITLNKFFHLKFSCVASTKMNLRRIHSTICSKLLYLR